MLESLASSMSESVMTWKGLGGWAHPSLVFEAILVCVCVCGGGGGGASIRHGACQLLPPDPIIHSLNIHFHFQQNE